MAYVIYLRKSRADEEAERRGEGETLARHRNVLLEVAKRMDLAVGGVYEEIVSGETISSRPQMQRLLSEVEAGQWDGVLVVEIERLARGNSIDQGIVSQTFKYSNTKIITPAKTYDPNNEFDEEYFEFGLFMSRREYQTIKRRMIAGRIASVKEGKYMGKTDPFGYTRVKLAHDKGYTLTPNPDEAQTVRNIFRWYMDGLGYRKIANRLNDAGILTKNGVKWADQTVRQVLRNCLYCGYVTWGRKAGVKSVINNQVVTKRKIMPAYIRQKGLHPPIISEETFEAVQNRLDQFPGKPVPIEKELRNPFQGLLHCAKCGHKMRLSINNRSEINKYRMWCPYKYCGTASSSITLIEDALLKILREWLSEYQTEVGRECTQKYTDMLAVFQSNLNSIQAEKSKAASQLQRAFELVEQGIYTAAQFLERQKSLSQRIGQLTIQQAAVENEMIQCQEQERVKAEIIPRMEHVISAFPYAKNAEEKNDLLRSILDKITYERNRNTDGTPGGQPIILRIYPIIPHAHT